MAIANARLLVGRTITAFHLNSFSDGKGGTAHNPVLYLDNGAKLAFSTEETEVGEYGVTPLYWPAKSTR
jgi:hypothetical protein